MRSKKYLMLIVVVLVVLGLSQELEDYFKSRAPSPPPDNMSYWQRHAHRHHYFDVIR